MLQRGGGKRLSVEIAHILRAWGRILSGRVPALSIEITRECPLRCPGCYAYGDAHLGGSLLLKQVSDYRGQDLINGILELVDEHRPLHVSLVGGEPLVRFRELSALLPQLSERRIRTQLVTSAVRPIPVEWRDIRGLTIVVSIDGLQPEHDARRNPATYDRILKHIQGHRIIVHCTVTSQMTRQPGYLQKFLEFWSARDEVHKIWMSLFTPQKGETSAEILSPDARHAVIEELMSLRKTFPKLESPKALLEVYRNPPRNPGECAFARTTRSITADLKRPITPCQFGGNPDCSQCGCIASAGLGAIARRRLPLGVTVGNILDYSLRVGSWVNGLREGMRNADSRKSGSGTLRPADGSAE